MKKIYKVILITSLNVFLSFNIISQTTIIPNGDFETWDPISYDNPTNWDSPNIALSSIPFNSTWVVSKESASPYAGTYSAKLECKNVNMITTSMIIPGFLTLGDLNVNISAQEYTISGGVPYTNRPDKLQGWFKFLPIGSDMAKFEVVLLNYDVNNSTVLDTIGAGYYFPSIATSGWESFDAEIEYFSSATPNYLNINILSSTDTTVGTTLWVDNLELYTEPSISFDLFFSEYIEGSGLNKALEIYNPSSAIINLDEYIIAQAANGGGWAYHHNFPLGSSLAPGDVWVIITDQVDTSLFNPFYADEILSYPSVTHHNGDDARALCYLNGVDTAIIDIIGDPDNDPGSGWDVAGVLEATLNHTLVRKVTIESGNADWLQSAGTNAINSEWIVTSQNDFSDLGNFNNAVNFPPLISGISLTPAIISPSDNVIINATVNDIDGSITQVSFSWGFDGTTFPNTIALTSLFDIYSTYPNYISAQPSGTIVFFRYEAIDNNNDTSILVQSYIVENPSVIVSIYEIQGQSVTSPYNGQTVTANGIITAVLSGYDAGYFIQDGSGAWNGIYVYDEINFPSIGDSVTITAEVDEYYDLTELKNVNSLLINSTGNSLPSFANVSTNEASSVEAYEGVLIQVLNANCTNPNASYGDWLVNDGSGNLEINNEIYTYLPDSGNTYNISGVVQYSFGAFELLPRFSSDIEDITSTNVIQYIELPLGWSFFSTYIIPFEPNIDSICAPFVAEVIIAKDGDGNTYWPQWGINFIDDLVIGKGYQIKVNVALTMEVEGLLVDPDTTSVSIPQGWSFLGYLRTVSAPLIDMMSPIASEIIIMKNTDGEIFWPQWSINDIIDLIPGEGYQIKLSTAQSLIYPSTVAVPFVITSQITNITSTTATGGGNVTNNGGSLITARGVCWNTSGNPTIANDTTNNGIGIGSFTSNLTGLLPSTPYSVRAYATNTNDTTFGNEVLFTTLATFPTVITDSITNITDTTAIGGGEVTSDGGENVTSRGICWNTTGLPTLSDSLTIDSLGVGIFTSNLTGLISSTSYYVRAYAINSIDTAFGNEVQFTTLPDSVTFISCGDTISDIDGNSYSTVLIGIQCWMAENLKVTHYPNGDTIPYITSNSAWAFLGNNNTDDAYCYYDNFTTNTNVYGALYTWAAAMGDNAVSSNSNPSGVQGACPTGWHLPSDNEWKQLEMQLGMSQTEADAYGWRGTNQGSQLAGNSSFWNSGNLENNTNFGTSGFTALPGGFRNYSDGSFNNLGYYGLWWSSTESSYSSHAWYRRLRYNSSEVERYYSTKSDGFSIRCIKDIVLFDSLTITTNNISDITNNSAVCGGNITSSGGTTVTARGVCWNTTGLPTLSDPFTIDSLGVGVYSSSLTGLISNTLYYVRAYAINSIDTAYGNEVQFTTLPDSVTFISCGSTITDIDGNSYNTVLIGNQCWMQENLKTTHYPNGDSIPNVTSNSAWVDLLDNNTDDAYSYNDNSSANANIYGALYTWAAAMGDNAISSSCNPCGVQGACPIGWHLPSDDEWKQLEMQLGMSQSEADQTGYRGTDQGSQLAGNSSLWNSGSLENNTNIGTSGFTALPGGGRSSYNGWFYGLGGSGLWWSSTEDNSSNAWCRVLYYYSSEVSRNCYSKSNGFSVRCLKDILTISTNVITNITNNSAVCGGNIISSGGSTVSARGVCWNTTGLPTLSDSLTIDSLGIGVFSSNLTGLFPDTLYYVRAYAINSIDTAFGDELQFTTLLDSVTFNSCENTITDIDGNSYNTVLIGTQCWMAENLTVTHYPNGTAIPNVTSNSSWAALGDNNADDAYCYCANSSANANTYGALYTWAAAMGDNAVSSSSNPSGVQGACPIGWHLPSDNEWKQLEMQLGMSQNEVDGTGYRGTNQGSQLAGNSSLWNSGSLENNTNFGTSGFTALPGGNRNCNNGSSYGLGSSGQWWSSTESYSSRVWIRGLFNNGSEVRRYGSDMSHGFYIRCLKDILTISTNVITNITNNSAVCGGNTTNSGGTTVTARGVCWNTTGLPTLSDSLTIDSLGIGVFSSNLTGLISNTLYYVRAYAINSIDTAYGNEVYFVTLPDSITFFSCGDTLVDIDGNSYNTVLISTQCWMAENLKTTHYPNGDTIPNVTSNSAWGALSSNNIDDAYCYYDNLSSNANTYGALYTWAAAMGDNAISSSTNPSGVQGACPTGWHLPSDNEWKQLEMHLGMSQSQADTIGYRGTDQGSQLAGNSTLWDSGNLENNAQFGTSGFTALPGGYRDNGWGSGSFDTSYSSGWWNSTEFTIYHAGTRALNYNTSQVERGYLGKSYGFSVRCLKDNLTISTNDIPCYGSVSGSADLNVSFGVSPYSYTWSNGAATEDINNLIAGTYIVTVTDANNVSVIDSCEIIEPPELLLDTLITHITVVGGSDGIINLTVSGGTPLYSYLWSTGATTEDIFNLTADIYIISITDVNNCTITGSFEILLEIPQTISCGDIITDIDGNSYNTVLIGTQCWMAENLKTTHYPNGDSIPNVTSNSAWENLGDNNYDDAYCYYDNLSSNANTYGALYTWAAAMGYNAVSSGTNPSGVQGACPTGWHLPSDNEWKQLEMELGMSQSEADQVSYNGTDQGSQLAGDSSLWESGNLENNAQFGTSSFMALPGGYREYNSGSFYGLGYFGYWWSSTEFTILNAWARGLYYNTSQVYRYNYGHKSYGFSVRCLKNIVLFDSLTISIYDISCYGSTNGSVDLTVSYGTSPYSYSWSNGATSENISNLIAGTYIVTVTDANNFSVIDSCEIIEPPELLLDTLITQVTVFGGSDGQIDILVSGGTPSYSYLWSSGATTEDIFNLIADIYIVTVTDANNCTSSGSFEILLEIPQTISCGDTISDYDGNSYSTVLIGTQCWMAENLKTTHYPNGDSIPNVTSNSAWGALLDNNIDDAYCYYDNSSSNANIYGALYTWAAAMGDNAVSSSTNPSGVQGACPTGWHLPSDNEWKQLEMQLGMSQSEADGTGYRGTDQGCQLAGNSTLWDSGNLENNAQFGTSGFTALPGGNRFYNGGLFFPLGIYGDWWSSTESGSSTTWSRHLYYNNSEVDRSSTSGYYKSDGFSVRCVKD